MCSGGLVPLSYIVGVGADGNGLGDEIILSAGKHADVVLRVPVGSTVRWAWGTHSDADIEFSVSTAAAAGAAPAGSGVLHVTRSILGVHQLDEATYRGPIPHGAHVLDNAKHVHTAGKLTDPMPGAAADGAAADVVAPHRFHKAKGETRVTAAAGGAASASDVLVRLRWSNAYSWLASKTLARRVDVLLPGDKWEAVTPEPDAAEREARARRKNVEAFGL